MPLAIALVRPQSRLICRSRILAALSSSRRLPPRIQHGPKTDKGRTNTPVHTSTQSGQGPNEMRRILRSGSDILKYIERFEISFKEEYVKGKMEHPWAFRWICFNVAVVILCTGVVKSIPLLFDWPPVLKGDIKAATWAIIANNSKAAVVHMGSAWIKIQSLPPEVLSPDPNLKILKVAGALAVVLHEDGQHAAALRVLSDALSLRHKRMSEQLARDPKGASREAISISKEERLLVIAMCLWLANILAPENSEYKRYYMAYAYAESIRLSRARSNTTGERMYKVDGDHISITPRPLKVLFSRFDLQNDPAFRGIDESDEGELCHTRPWYRREFQFPFSTLDGAEIEANSDWVLMMLSLETMGDYCKRVGQPLLSAKCFIDAIPIVPHTNQKPEDFTRLLRVINKLFIAVLGLHASKRTPQTEKSKLPSIRNLLDNCNRIEPSVILAEFRTGQRSSNASEFALFYAIHGRAYLMSGQPDESAKKFERGMKLAKAYGSKEVERLASEGLRISQSYMINRETRSTTPEDDNTSHLLRL